MVCSSQPERFSDFPSWYDDRDILIVIDWGMDESEQQSKNLLVLSAVIGPTAQMKKLKRSWTKTLTQNGVDFFHAKDHWNQKYEPYHGLSRDKREIMLSDFVSSMHKRCDGTLSVEVNRDEFENNVSSRFKNTFGSAYAWGVNMLLTLTRIHLVATRCIHEEINILIEDGHKNAQQAIDLVKRGREKPGTVLKIKSYGLGGKVGNPILQAADLTAYGLSQMLSTGASVMHDALYANPPRTFKRAFLPWGKSCLDAIKDDVEYQAVLKKLGLKVKPFEDRCLW